MKSSSNEELLFSASDINNLKEIDINTKVYSDINSCIFDKVKSICSKDGIKPNFGVLMDAMDNTKTYTFIERYDNQFELLKQNISIYSILKKDAHINDDNRLIEKIKPVKEEKIHSLLQYLNDLDNVELIVNNNVDKWWYDIPSDNGDIIQEKFQEILKLDRKSQLKCLKQLRKLLPNQKVIIKDLYKLINMMPEDEKQSFVNSLYIKRYHNLNYDDIKDKTNQYKKN